jgi:FKBP-type peptidyl-prolyl cis-trans isomerase FkpA
MKPEMSRQPQAMMRNVCCLLVACLPAMLAADPVNPASPASIPPPDAHGVPYNPPTSVPAPGVPATSAPKANAPAPAVAEYTEEQLLTEAGWLIGKRSQFADLGFTEDQITAILQGMRLALAGKDAPLSVESAAPKISLYMQNRMQAARAAAQKAAESKEAAFFADLKSKGIPSTPSGLYYEIIQPGSEKKPAATDSVTVNYTGHLLDGKVFDSSASKGRPSVFQLNRVIRAWTEGLQLIGEGGKIKLYVPFSMAYGARSQPNLPAFSTLEFEVELVSIKPPPTVPSPLNRPQVKPVAASPAPGSPVSAAPAAPNNPAPTNPIPASPAPASSSVK